LLRWEIDTNGNSTNYTYSEHRPEQIITATSRTKFYYGADNAFGVLSGDPKSQYAPYTWVLQTRTNDHGDVTMTGDAHGNTVYNTFEDDGTLSHSIRSVLNVDHDHDPETPNRDFEYKDVSEYDEENRIIGTRRLVRSFVAGATPSGDYLEAWSTDSNGKNPLGQDETLIDKKGNQTLTTYDERGLAIQTVQATSEANVYLVTRTVYNSKGRALVSTDSYRGLVDGTPLPGVTLSGTRYTYDAEEHATKTEQIRDFSVSFTGPASALTSNFTAGSGFEILSKNESDYDSTAWLTDSTDDHGLKSTPTYNRFGETVESRSESRSGTGALVTFVSRTVYDDKGREVVSTDSQVLGSTDPIHGTITIYDSLGRAFETRRVKGLTFQMNTDNSLFKDANGNFVVTGQGETLSLSRSEYNDRGQVIHSISETFDNGTSVGLTSDFTHDEFGRRVSTTGPASLVDGNLVRHRTFTTYAGSRVASETTNIVVNATTGLANNSNARTTSYKYDEDGNVVRTTYHDGSFTADEFDKFGRKIGESQMTAGLPMGHFAAWDETTKQFVQMDGSGSGAPVQVGVIPTRSMEYDDLGRLVKVTLPAVLDMRTTDPSDMTRPFYEYGYDATGNQTLVRDPLGRETLWGFDTEGREITRTLPLGAATLNGLGSGTDPRTIAGTAGAFTEGFWYDTKGRQTLHVSFEGSVTQFIFDDSPGSGVAPSLAIGRLLEKRTFTSLAAYNNGAGTASSAIQFAYDAQGRQATTIQDADGNFVTTTTDQRTVTQQFNVAGQVSAVVSAEGVMHYEYDNQGRKTATWTGADASSKRTETKYTYDSLGRTSAVKTTIRNGVTLTQPEIDEYFYDLTGNLDKIKYDNDVVADYSYDLLNRLHQLKEFRDDGDFLFETGVDALMAEYAYQTGADGRRTGVTETDDLGRVTEIDWTYDSIGRLVRESYNSFDNSLDFIADYVLDLVGNRLQKLTDKNPTFSGSPSFDETVTSVFDANDRLLIETQDTAGTSNDRFTVYQYGSGATSNFGGNVTQQSKRIVYAGLDSSGTKLEETTSTFNNEERLVQVQIDSDGDNDIDSTVTYSYDADGVRVAKDENGQVLFYLVDHQNPTGYSQVIEELKPSATAGQLDLVRSFKIGLDVLGQSNFGTTPQTFILLYDGHGSTRTLVDRNGFVLTADGVAQRFAYDAYGNAIGFTPAQATTTLLYSGEQFDSSTQLQYLRARYYDLRTGRFQTLDQFRGVLTEPISLHKYSYVENDPIQLVDPSGRFGVIGFVGGALSNALGRIHEFTNKRRIGLTAFTALQNAVTIVGAGLSIALNPNPSGFLVNFGYGISRAGIGFGGYITLYFDKATGDIYGYLNGELASAPLSAAFPFTPQNQGPIFQYGAAWNVIDPSDLSGLSMTASVPFALVRYSKHLNPLRWLEPDGSWISGNSALTTVYNNLRKAMLGSNRLAPPGSASIAVSLALTGTTTVTLGRHGYTWSGGIAMTSRPRKLASLVDIAAWIYKHMKYDILSKDNGG
ncbi:MAG: RHS repeat-associated core domain-containing protein, partial [Pirellulaceae bacterium]